MISEDEIYLQQTDRRSAQAGVLRERYSLIWNRR